jgi:uncharacterized protein (DUF58 family)
MSVVIGALAVVSGQAALFRLVDVLLATLLICGLWSLLSVRGLTFERFLREDRAQVGGSFEQQWLLRGRLPFPRLWTEIADGGTLPGYRAGHVLDLGLGGRRAARLDAPCRRRGRYEIGPARVSGTDPLGLFRSSRRIGKPRSVLVYPATVDLVSPVLPAGKFSGGVLRRKTWHQTSSHVSGTREYRPGDPLRHVHWRSTAHSGQLMVKEFDAEPIGNVWICLDLEATVQRGEGDDSTEEYAVTIAASLAKHLLGRGQAIGLVAVGTEHRILPMDRGQRQLMRALEELAVVHATGSIPLADVLMGENQRFSASHGVLVVTPSSDDRWSAALQGLHDRGTSVGAIVLEANTFGDAPGAGALLSAMARWGIPCRPVKRGDPLSEALAHDAPSGQRG